MTFQHVQEKPYSTRRYVPVVSILAAVTTLILLLVIYTSRNISLARQRLEESLFQEGLTLIRAMEAGNRTGMRMRWAMNNLQILGILHARCGLPNPHRSSPLDLPIQREQMKDAKF